MRSESIDNSRRSRTAIAQAADEPGGTVAAAGILRIRLLDFLQQLTTFRVEGRTVADRAAALARFGRLFLGDLWDVYATRLLSSGPF